MRISFSFLKRNFLVNLALAEALVLFTSFAHAAIEVKLKEPKWEFLLQNEASSQREAQLSAGESDFARKIQPLLSAQNHAAILQAFESRNIENDSAALRQLRGQVLLSLGRNKDAEQALNAALKLMPDLALAHRSLSLVYMLEKNYAQARKHLRRSIELGVADAQVYGQLAFVNLQTSQAASAVAGYEYALLLDPENKQWQQGLLYALINSQAFDQAQAMLEQMLKDDPQNADLWLQRGQIALQKERPLQALSSLEVALQLGENSAENLATTAQLHIQNGSPRRAVTLLSNNIRQFTSGDNSKIEVLDQISEWLAFQRDWIELGKLMQALAQSKVKLSPMYQSRFDVYRAQLDIAKGENKRARHNLERAIEADPTNGEALLTLATVLRDENRSERALLYFVRAEALPLFKERALLGRAQLEINRQNYAEALRLLRQVAQANPSRRDVLANIESLENLVRNQG